MATYSFVITLDDDDLPVRVAESERADAAIEEACEAMMAPVYVLRPALARCVVFADGQRLGDWTYRAASPVPLWLEVET